MVAQKTRYPKREVEAALEAMASGAGISEYSRKTGIPRTTISGWIEQQGRHHEPPTPKQPQPSQDSLRDMELASLRSQLNASRAAAPLATPCYLPPASSDPASRWRAAEQDNAEHISKALAVSKFTARLPDEPCAVTFISDQHISLGNTVDLERMREDAELVAGSDGCYAILGGDATDNHIKHRSAVLAARSQPSDQYELFEYYLGILAHRVLVAISGNHDLWTNQMAGVDVLAMLLKKQSVCYAPDEALLDLQVGGQTYQIGMRHQFRMNSSFNETHAVKQWFRLGEQAWDIGCIGHNHISAIEPFWAHGVERWAARPGSYQITSAYSRQFGFSKTRPMCPTFILYPDRREIIGFHDLRPALRMLRAERC